MIATRDLAGVDRLLVMDGGFGASETVLAKTKLTMPVLSIAGEKASAAILVPQMKLVATNVAVVNLKDTGHWLMEERPQETMEALVAFL